MSKRHFDQTCPTRDVVSEGHPENLDMIIHIRNESKLETKTEECVLTLALRSLCCLTGTDDICCFSDCVGHQWKAHQTTTQTGQTHHQSPGVKPQSRTFHNNSGSGPCDPGQHWPTQAENHRRPTQAERCAETMEEEEQSPEEEEGRRTNEEGKEEDHDEADIQDTDKNDTADRRPRQNKHRDQTDWTEGSNTVHLRRTQRRARLDKNSISVKVSAAAGPTLTSQTNLNVEKPQNTTRTRWKSTLGQSLFVPFPHLMLMLLSCTVYVENMMINTSVK